MPLITNLLEENLSTAAQSAASSTSRGLTDAPFPEEPIQEEESGFFDDVKDVAMAPLRGLEGFAQGIYNLGDALTFDALPDWDKRFLGKSETVVGGLVEGATQFLTAFIPIGGVLGKAGQGLGLLQKGAKGLEYAGALAKAGTTVQKAAKIGRGVAQGAITDFIAFDGQDERLSNLVESFPALKNPVTDYLQASPDDGEIEGRFKNVVEGLFLEAGQQALAPLFTRGVKAMKDFRSKVAEGVDPSVAAREASDELNVEIGNELKAGVPSREFIADDVVEAPVDGLGKTPEAVEEATGARIAEEPVINPETGLPVERTQGGKQARETIPLDILRNAKTSKELAAGLIELTNNLQAKGVDFKSPELMDAQIRSNYAQAGLDPADWDALKASTTPDVFNRIIIQQDLLNKEIRRSGEEWLALGKQTEGKTGDELLALESRIEDVGQNYRRALELYSSYGAGWAAQGRARQTGVKKGITPSSLSDVKPKESLDNYDRELEDLVNKFDTESEGFVTPPGKEGEPGVKTPEDVAFDYDKRIADLNGELAVQRKLFLEDPTRPSPKVTVDDQGKPIPPKASREKTLKERDLEGKIAFYEKAKKENVELQKAIKEYDEVRKMSPARLKELEDLQAARNDLKIKLPASRAKEVKARTEALKKALKEDPAAKLKAAEELQAKRLAGLTADKRAKLEELRNDRSYGGKDAPEAKAKAIKEIDPELATLNAQIAEHKAAIKEAADYDAVVKQLEKLSGMTPAQARKEAFELKARRDLIPKKPARSIDALKAEVNKYRSNLVKMGKEQMTADNILRREDFAQFAKERLGSKTKQELNRQLQVIGNIDDLEKRMAMVAYAQNATSGRKMFDVTYETWINNLFSPATHVVNALGGITTGILRSVETIVGRALIGDFAYVKAHFNALTTVQGMHEVMEAAALAIKTGDSVLNKGSYGAKFGKVVEEGQFDGRVVGGALSANTFNINPDSTFGKMIDWAGKASRINTTLLTGGDELMKQVLYRQFLRTEIYAEGLQKGIKDGPALTNYVERKLKGLVLEGGKMYNERNLAQTYAAKARAAGITPDMGIEYDKFIAREYELNPFNKQKGALADAAYEYSLKGTFQNEPGDAFTTAIMGVLDKHPSLKFVLPFVKTPTNILKFGLARSPFGLAKDSILLATSKKFRDIHVNGTPAAKADLIGRMTTASTFSFGAMYYMMNNGGAITGGGPQNKEEKDALKATGWQPYSIKIGDKYISYNRLDPIATPLGIMADIAEFNRITTPSDDSGADAAMSALLVSLTYNLTDKSYLRGLNNLMNTVRDPETYGPKFVQDIASGFIPNTLNQLQNTESQVILRDARTLGDAMQKRIPGLGDKLPPQRTFLGDVIYRDNPLGLLGSLSPVYVSTIKNDAVDQEVSRLIHGFTMPPPKLYGIDDLNMRNFTNEKGDQAYDRYMELSGTVKLNDRNLRQALSSLIKSPEYKRLPSDSMQDQIGKSSPRINLINKVVRRYRNIAQIKMLGEFPELYNLSKQVVQQQRDYRLGKFDNQQ